MFFKKYFQILFIFFIIVAVNLVFLIAQIYLFQISIFYFDLFEGLLEDINLINLSALLSENFDFPYVITIFGFFVLLIFLFVFGFKSKIFYFILQEKSSLESDVFFSKLKERSPPLD